MSSEWFAWCNCGHCFACSQTIVVFTNRIEIDHHKYVNIHNRARTNWTKRIESNWIGGCECSRTANVSISNNTKWIKVGVAIAFISRLSQDDERYNSLKKRWFVFSSYDCFVFNRFKLIKFTSSVADCYNIFKKKSKQQKQIVRFSKIIC